MNKKTLYIIVLLLVVAITVTFVYNKKQKQMSQRLTPGAAAQLSADKEVEGDESAQIFPEK
jgi:preprotein translocase subunit SecG